jgi:hypothetical protein
MNIKPLLLTALSMLATGCAHDFNLANDPVRIQCGDSISFRTQPGSSETRLALNNSDSTGNTRLRVEVWVDQESPAIYEFDLHTTAIGKYAGRPAELRYAGYFDAGGQFQDCARGVPPGSPTLRPLELDVAR